MTYDVDWKSDMTVASFVNTISNAIDREIERRNTILKATLRMFGYEGDFYDSNALDKWIKDNNAPITDGVFCCKKGKQRLWNTQR